MQQLTAGETGDLQSILLCLTILKTSNTCPVGTGMSGGVNSAHVLDPLGLPNGRKCQWVCHGEEYLALNLIRSEIATTSRLPRGGHFVDGALRPLRATSRRDRSPPVHKECSGLTPAHVTEYTMATTAGGKITSLSHRKLSNKDFASLIPQFRWAILISGWQGEHKLN